MDKNKSRPTKSIFSEKSTWHDDDYEQGCDIISYGESSCFLIQFF